MAKDDMEVVVSGEPNENRSSALIKKYKAMADIRRDYEDIDIKDCIPTLDEMVQDDLMYEILEAAANGDTEKDVTNAAYYTEQPPTTELGYNPDGNVFVYKIGSVNFSEADKNLNKIDGDTFRVPINNIIEGQDKAIKMNNGESFENFKDYCSKKDLISDDDDYIQIRLFGVDCPEIPHYEIQPMKESDIVSMTVAEARKKKAVIEKWHYSGTAALDRDETEKISLYKVGNSYYEIVGNDPGFVPDEEKAAGYVYKKIVITDDSTKESLVGGYQAQQNLINILEGGNIYIMLDANGIKANKTSKKYKLYYNHWWNVPETVADMIDQWCNYSKQPALTRLSYSPYGTDGHGRFIGTAYAPKDGLYTNVAKYNIADDSTNSVYQPDFSGPELGNLGGSNSTWFDSNSYEPNNRVWLDAFSEITKESYKQRIEFHKEVTGLDFTQLRNCTMMIGDTLFLIPPQNIRSLSSIDYERVGIMRGKGSMVKNSTNREMFLEVDLYFYNGDGVNGIPKEVEMPNKEKITYYMDGLRSLIAQFKVAPYLPIENQFINDVLGIEAVSLMGLNVSTVEGIPRLLRATLTMRDFNYRIYMPDIPIDYSSNQAAAISQMNPIFAKCFNWEVFRYYYQRLLSYGNALKNLMYGTTEYNKELYGKKEILQPVYFCEKDGFGASDISFYVPDENWLKAALTIKKDKDKTGQNVVDIELSKAEEDFFKRAGSIVGDLHTNSTYAQRLADYACIGASSKSRLGFDTCVNYTGKDVDKVTPQSSSGVTIPANDSELFKGYKQVNVSGNNMSGKRKTNAVVDIGYGDRKYWGFTNQYGQLFKVVARKITLQDDSKESTNEEGRYYDDEAKVPGVEHGDLDEGHVIADSLGGVSNAYNITPQNSTLNRTGSQAKVEEEIRKAGGCTDFVAIITYPNTKTQIPSHYSYTYTINGSKKTVDFANEEPGTKEFDSSELLENLLSDVIDVVESCGLFKLSEIKERYSAKEKCIEWDISFYLTNATDSSNIQLIREKLKDLTGSSSEDVLKGNKLTVTIKSNIVDNIHMDPNMTISCPELYAMSNYVNGVDPMSDVSTYDYMDPSTMQFIPYIENIEVQNISFTLTNNFSDITLKIMDGFAPQYMGSSDISIELSFITTDTHEVSMLNVLPAHAANIGKLYRRILSCWPIKVRNQYLQLAGINEVLIDLIEVQTVQGFPGAYEVRMRLTSVDRTMRQRETMKQLESDKKTSDKGHTTMNSYWDFERVLSLAELYPDLDLPSLKEMEKYGFYFIRYRNTKQAYPDPDFYISYSWPYTSYIIKKNLKDVFYEKVFHDEGKDKAEILDDTNYMFFDQMGMELYRKLDPYTGTTEGKGKDGKTQNDLADLYDEEIEVIDSSSEETIKKNSKSDKEKIEDEDCSQLSDLLIYLTACDIQEGWTIKPGITAPVVINETNLAVEKLECSGLKHEETTEDDLHNAYAQDIFNLRAEAIKAIDDYLSEPINYGTYDFSLHTATITSSNYAEGYEEVIGKVVEAFAGESKGKKILELLNPFENTWAIDKHGFFSQMKENLKGDATTLKDTDYSKVNMLNYLSGFLYSAAKTITDSNIYTGDSESNSWEPSQYRIDGHGNVIKDKSGNRIPNCKIERDGKSIDFADSLDESLKCGIQWGMFQIKRYRASELQRIMQPKSRVKYVDNMPMYKDPKTGKERWHPGFIDPYYNIAGYKSKVGKEYIEKIATSEGINTIAFIRVCLMHLRRMIIDGQIFSEIDIVAKDYEDVKDTIFTTVTNEDFNEAMKEDVESGAINDVYKDGGDVIDLFKDMFDGDPLKAINDYFALGSDGGTAEHAQEEAIEDAGMSEEMAETVQELLENLPDTYKRSFCARLIYPVLMAVTENNEQFNNLINNCQLSELNGLTAGIVLTSNSSESVSPMTKFVKAMYSIGLMEFSANKTDPETTSDSQKLWNYIMKEAYTKLADDPQAYVLHSYYDMLINDKRGRLIRAFPTYYMIFIDEGRKIGSWKLFDNFYNMSAISEITVSKSRKIPADTCSFVMSNMYASYASEYDNTTKQQYVDVYGLRDVFNSIFCPAVYVEKEHSLRLREQNLETVVLKPGVRIHVRMGYGADAARLPIAFNGRIAEIDVNDVVTVLAQGDGVELVNPLNTLGEMDVVSLTESQTWTTMFKDLRGSLKRGGESPRNLLSKLLTAKYGGVIKTALREYSDSRWFGDNPFGIYHFGDKRFNYIFEEGECVQNLYEVCDATLLKGSNELYAAEENIMATPTINTTLQDKTFWDILQLCAHSGVGYMGAIRDFGMRSSVCLCKPNHYYAFAYKKIDDNQGQTEGKVIERRKPFQQYHYYDSYTDIVYNSIKASERNMKTNATGLWESTDMIWGRSQSTVGPVYLDFNIYPEHQKAMTVDTTLVSDGAGGLELNLFTHFSENWASSSNDNKVNKALAERVTTNVLRESVSNMYCGEVCVLGDTSVKPYDRFYINDYYEDMQGHMEVEGVVYSMNSSTGFTTTIYPDLIVRMDDNHEAARQMVSGSFIASLTVAVGGRLMGISTFARIDSALINALGKVVGGFIATPLDEAAAAGVAGLVSRFFGVPKTKSILEAVKLVFNGAVSGVSIATTAAIAAGIYIVSNNAKSWLTSFLRNIQALTVYPIVKNQKPLIAGMAGHKGSVYGYEYTEEDAEDSIQGLIVNSVNWLNDYLPFNTGDILMNAFTAKTTDANGNKISEYQRMKEKWGQTLPLEGEAQQYKYYPGDTSLTDYERREILLQELYNSANKEFSSRNSTIQALRTKYRIPNLQPEQDDVFKKYHIQGVTTDNIATNNKILALYPIEDETDVKQATVKNSHPVVKQLHIAHSQGNYKIQMPFESGNRIIKLFADNASGKLVFDLPMLQEDALMVLKLILNDQALKNEKVTFLSGTRVNETATWRSTGFAFIIGAKDLKALKSAIDNVQKQTTFLNGNKEQTIFTCKEAGEDGYLIIVHAPRDNNTN